MRLTGKFRSSGTSTINNVNSDNSTKYFFPLVAYSLFNKVPTVSSSSGYRKYTDKYKIDSSNRFYYNSFVPSLNLVELLKKCCELKGYTLQGDVINDNVLNDIYLSNYISDEQDPLYNYGDSDMGELSFDISFKNYTNNDGSIRFPLTYIDYMLAHPIPYPSAAKDYQNYTNFFVYNLLDEKHSTISNVVNESKLLVDGGIQIPADGYYEITLTAELGVPSSQGTITGVYECTGFERSSKNGNSPRVYEEVDVDYSLFNMPVEIQLLKYSADDGDVESISHDLIYKGEYPNEYVLDSSRRAAQRTSSTSSDRVASRGGNSRPAPDRTKTAYTYTNITSSTEGQIATTAVDTYNNPNFICGISQSNWSRSIGYIKNGYSWNYDDRTTNTSLYNCNGYYYYEDGYKQTQVNANTLIGARNEQLRVNGRFVNGTCRIVVLLNKNDMLVPFAQCRAYYDEDGHDKNYKMEVDCSIKIRALAPYTVSSNELSYNMESLFDKNLNLGNFNNNEQKISDFFNDVQKAFNLSFKQDGNNIILNKNKINIKETAPIDIDKKVNTNDAIFNSIDFPRSIEVKFSVDTEEEGFYRSVEDNTTEEQMQSNNWKDYGDYGYQKVNISQADDATDLSQSLGFSYNWNRNFSVEYPETSTMTRAAVENIEKPVLPEVPDDKEDDFVEGGGGGGSTGSSRVCMDVVVTNENGCTGDLLFKNASGTKVDECSIDNGAAVTLCYNKGATVYISMRDNDGTSCELNNGGNSFTVVEGGTVYITISCSGSGGGGGNSSNTGTTTGSTTPTSRCMDINFIVEGVVNTTVTFKRVSNNTTIESVLINNNRIYSLCNLLNGEEIIVNIDSEDVDISVDTFTFMRGGNETITLTKFNGGSTGSTGTTGSTGDDTDDDGSEDDGGGGSDCMNINYTLTNSLSTNVIFESLFGDILGKHKNISSNRTEALCGIPKGTVVWVKADGTNVYPSGDWPNFTFNPGSSANITLTYIDGTGGGSGDTSGNTSGDTTGSTTGSTGTTSVTTNVVNIPVIGKTEWWIEGLDYEGSSQNDGRGFKQRLWFRGKQTGIYIPVNGTIENTDDFYNITTTSNYKEYNSDEIVYLNYNNGVNTLLGKFFNIDIDSRADEVEIEVYLTPMEYKQISMGCSVHFDDNIYKILEIQGYDPSGNNPTKLKLLSY